MSMAMALGLAQALVVAPQSTNLTRRSTGCVRTPMLAFQGLRATRGAADAVNVQRLRQHAVATAPRRRASGAAVRCTATNGSNGKKHNGMNIVFVAAEVAPWSKTGGLGDVLGGLPPALAARGHRVMTVSPRYDQYKDAWDTNTPLEITVNGRTETVNFFHTHERGVDRVFVDHPLFLAKVWGKTGSRIYGPNPGEDYDDNQFRFQLLAKAAIEAARVLSLDCNESFSGPYGEDVVFVANDWHTALLPCYLKSEYKPAGQFVNAKVAFCVHNTACQGRFASADFDRMGLPDKFRNSFMDGYGESGRKINWMKAGLLESDQELDASSEMGDVTLLSDTMKRAIKVRGCMGEDLSWKGPARLWEDTLLDLEAEDSDMVQAEYQRLFLQSEGSDMEAKYQYQ